jgi:hypothetical protein
MCGAAGAVEAIPESLDLVSVEVAVSWWDAPKRQKETRASIKKRGNDYTYGSPLRLALTHTS